MFEDERHFCGVHQLLAGLVFHRNAFGPEFDRFAVGDFEQLVSVIFHVFIRLRIKEI
ncbi:hypothetical protein D3C81_2093220 [compost metagenome]